MLISGWSYDEKHENYSTLTDIRSENGYQAQVYAGLLSFAPFIWTLVAPLLFPDREFN
jgi:hypothetical protein